MTDEQLFVSIYTDEDVTDRLAELLREHGFIAATTAEWSMTGATDEQQLCAATERGHAILTFIGTTSSPLPVGGSRRTGPNSA